MNIPFVKKPKLLTKILKNPDLLDLEKISKAQQLADLITNNERTLLLSEVFLVLNKGTYRQYTLTKKLRSKLQKGHIVWAQTHGIIVMDFLTQLIKTDK